MIEVSKASEKRERDVGRDRILLSIGERSWHLDRQEAEDLCTDLRRVLDGTQSDSSNDESD